MPFTRPLTGAELLSLNQKVDRRTVLGAGTSHSWAELVAILGNKSKASRLLSACRAAGLVTTTGGRQGDRKYVFKPEK